MRSHQPLERLLVDGRRRRYLLIALTGIAQLYETSAIIAYLEEIFPAPSRASRSSTEARWD
jgi:glutathione S-transferase